MLKDTIMRAILLLLAHGIAWLTLLSLPPAAAAQGTPIGFEEEFALSADRAASLEQLIPGTEESYFYRCLHLQNEGALDQVGPLLSTWIERHGRSARVEEIENRQALLGFDRDPEATYQLLRRRLGLRFDHQRQVSGEKPDLPTQLDPELLSPETLSRRALAAHPGSLDGFRDSAFESLAGSPLTDALLMSLLKRLERPDLPNLPALVVRNLADKQSRGFGSLAIHGNLLLEQLEECARLMPALLRQDAFIQACLLRLRPGADADWRRDASQREAYLTRLQQFTERLGPAFNSLKAHVLYHRLVHDLGQGRPNKQRLLAYLRLPRNVSYVNPAYLKSRSRGEELVSFAQSYPTALDAIGNDEALVRAYLSHFFASEDSYEAYAEFVREDYLSRLFAETKILLGSGDLERWYSLLDDPAYYEQLKERVEIDFPPHQQTEFGAGDPVAIEVDLKNVDTLLVKVFEINTLNYYTEQNREIDASINLDGLVANQERTYVYDESPLRRIRRAFEFENLKAPGIYVIDWIGNGLSSRAVIRLGSLRFLERQGAAGHVLTVLDERGRHLKDASVRLGGREYPADERGEVLIPYSTKPGSKPIILFHDGFATLRELDHEQENYRLEAGAFLERESLLPGRRAKLLLRPTLLLNGNTVSLDLLEQATLQLTSKDWHGVSSSLEVRDLKLSGRNELIHEIQVPEQLSSLTVRLFGRVRNLSLGETIDVASAPREFQVNAIENTPLTACPLLGRSAAGYVLDLLGKNGEPRPDAAVALTLTHRDYTDPIQVTLKTDAEGRITLGALDGIETAAASGLPDTFGRWNLRPAERTYPDRVQGRAGQVLRVPYQGRATTLSRGVASLLELRGGVFAHDRFDHLFLREGELELRDLAPGDYSLVLKEAGRRIEVRVTAGVEQNGFVLGQARVLELSGSAPLQILETRVDGTDLLVRLRHAGTQARVHLFATRYLPAFDVFSSLRLPERPRLSGQPVPWVASSYHSGREIGAEYRYILERRYAKKFPGNMLHRPGLLLNPWALEETDSTIGLGGGAGGRFGGRYGGKAKSEEAGSGGPGTGGPTGTPGTFPNLAFLAAPSKVLANLEPDADGVVRIPLAELGDGQLVHAVAVDGTSTVYRSLALPEEPLQVTDRRLTAALDPARHLAELRRIEFVEPGGLTVIEDVATSEAESYDSLASVHQLFLTLSGNPDLSRFEFVLRWPELDEQERRKLYSENACHELHFFLYRKDPAFFQAVIRPYLANKAHKTFLDHWLLEEDLTSYLDPWAFSRLNVVERILLSQRLEGQAESVARHVRELLELQPVDPVLLGGLFETALKGKALEPTPSFAGFLSGMGRDRRYKGPSDARPPGARRPRAEAAKDGPAAPQPDPAQEAEGAELADFAEDKVLEGELEKEETLRVDLRRRAEQRPLYRAPAKTRKFVEHNYWHRPIEEQDSRLITVNEFWRDYADRRGSGPFFSTHFPQAAGSFAEMLLALAVLDLPFAAGEHELASEDGSLSIRAASPLLLVRKDLREATRGSEPLPLQVHQDFFRLDDRYRHDGSERRDKFVTGEFQKGVAYGCQVVLTNPGSVSQKLEVLLQIPEGAIPVDGGFETRGVPVEIEAYGTAKLEYAFYFPEAGGFPHYPVHAGRDGELLAFADPVTFEVVAVPSRVDSESWEHISQSGTPAEVLEFLKDANLLRTDLSRIAWRLRERGFFDAVLTLLRRRHVYDDVLWSYGLQHEVPLASREYLRHADGFLSRCGPYLESPLADIDPIERWAYQHVEYEPLFNGRAHRFGRQREIQNADLARQYLALLDILAYRPRLDDTDWMSVTYYLLLQDRVAEALASFAKVNAERLDMALQYDYLSAYMDFFADDHSRARAIAERYQDHPVERWRSMFQDVVHQLDEAAGLGLSAGDPEDRTQRQTELAASEPSLELKVESQSISLDYRNLENCRINYYVMDIEFLFSTSAFVQQGSDSFSFIQPNRADTLRLPPGEHQLTFDLPEEFQNSNVLVEVRGGGLSKRQAYYANSLSIQLIENYGQLKVSHRETDRPLPKVYVKVYARTAGGKVRFHKDGYTDLRGRFDYASLSGEGAADAERYAILILSESDGAVIREASPPLQ